MNIVYIKLIIAILLDIADFTIGRIIGFGSVGDVVLAVIGYIMFGPKGLIQLWELGDLSDQIDGFVPTLTLLALYEVYEFRKSASAKDNQQS